MSEMDAKHLHEAWRGWLAEVDRIRTEAVAARNTEIIAAVRRLREHLSALEHAQWVEWAGTVAREGMTPERITRWGQFMVPYSLLDEATKDHDRKWADIVLAAVLAIIEETR